MIRNFPADLHKEAKLQAVQEEISLKDLVIKALTEYLKKAKVK
jgi:predicted HicB family RNase H-like nuclease